MSPRSLWFLAAICLANVLSAATVLAQCDLDPVTTCRAAGKAQVNFKNDLVLGENNWFGFHWFKADTPLSAFGDPTTTTGYTICVYDTTGLVMEAFVDAALDCLNGPCWTAQKTGFRYADSTGDSDGITHLKLKAGDLGKANVKIKGHGEFLPNPTLPLSPPVSVQMVNDDGECWSADFTATPKRNDEARFRAAR